MAETQKINADLGRAQHMFVALRQGLEGYRDAAGPGGYLVASISTRQRLFFSSRKFATS